MNKPSKGQIDNFDYLMIKIAQKNRKAKEGDQEAAEQAVQLAENGKSLVHKKLRSCRLHTIFGFIF